ncbi:phospholipase D-like domain-containing protein [Frondihabitans peucedani]|uniref:phospholipase D n=1 Tax=Frondihabitans peucedani TaxID=598626 RepID=A0ABP8E3J1_9MICO
MAITTSDIQSVIERSAAILALPGVLSVRPGYVFRDGWITTERAVVVTVVGEPPALPAELEGVPLDVRAATESKALQVQDPVAYARVTGPTPDLGAVPAFASELRVVAGPSPALHRIEAPTEHSASGFAQPEASKPQLPYQPPAGASLAPVDLAPGTTVELSASPDSGWPTLAAFLHGTESSLTVGLYDFTSAHVLQTVERELAGKRLRLVLDHPAKNPTADQTDEATVVDLAKNLGDGLEQAWALDRMDPLAAAWIFPTAYHIKVAVRDSASVWLSSGNWNNSNQPDIDPVTVPSDADEARTRDRDWHVVIHDEGLASTFEAFLANDLSTAEAHDVTAVASAQAERLPAPEVLVPAASTPPFQQFFAAGTATDVTRVTPVLTPDAGVYVTAVRELIESAETSLHLQFQYIELPKTASDASKPFADLVAAVVDRQKAGVDVRIIMSQFETAGFLEQLQAAGLDVMTRVRLQSNVHNKGIVVDGRRVLVSSQNWSTAGVLSNRDAGVILDSVTAATYFDTIFEHDWAHLAGQKARND